MPAKLIRLAALRDGRLTASAETLAAALHGKVTAHYRFLLSQHLGTMAHLEQTVAAFERQIEAVVAPFNTRSHAW